MNQMNSVLNHLLMTTTTVLQPSYRSTHVSRNPQLGSEGSDGAKFYYPHALAENNLCTWIRQKVLEFSSVMLPTHLCS